MITSQVPPLVGPICRICPSFTRASRRRWTLLSCKPNSFDNSALVIVGFAVINSTIRFFCSVLIRFWFGLVRFLVCLIWSIELVNVGCAAQVDCYEKPGWNVKKGQLQKNGQVRGIKRSVQNGCGSMRGWLVEVQWVMMNAVEMVK